MSEPEEDLSEFESAMLEMIDEDLKRGVEFPDTGKMRKGVDDLLDGVEINLDAPLPVEPEDKGMA